ncbi:hypothetical protein KR76_07055 [Pimelobacter simplex]|uniref:Uncharacterized protein n=1 Tax=Nocardioides simplex TaxID=2045 RepID=A0A0A1DMI3_NOCSI|nr:hypothetical protein KR76_07055 [Pimelobacter simplex]
MIRSTRRHQSPQPMTAATAVTTSKPGSRSTISGSLPASCEVIRLPKRKTSHAVHHGPSANVRPEGVLARCTSRTTW